MNKKLLFIILTFLGTTTLVAQSSTTETLSYSDGTSKTFTVPCGVTSLTVEAWGGGGAGGGGASKGAGGGAGGAYSSAILSVVPGQNFTYTVGAGGTGGTGTGATGSESWFGSSSSNKMLIAKGGAGGSASNGNTATGGSGNTTGSVGAVLFAGANGNNGSNTASGAGGASGNYGGNGGASLNSGSNGNNGGLPGGGGGGSFANTSTNRSGGSGGSGQIKVTYQVPSSISTTPVSICQGGSGSLTASTGVTTFAGRWTTTDPVATRPIGEGGTTNIVNCEFEGPGNKRNYSYILFQVSVSGSYEFKMTENNNYDGIGYIVTEDFIPGSCTAGGSWIVGDDDDGGGGGKEPRMTANLVAGTVYKLVSTLYGNGNYEIFTGDYTWTVTPPAGGLVYLNPTVKWYTAATGGSAIASGAIFNPVGVAGSGLTNTNTPGTNSYYAGYGDTCSRTEANFAINTASVAGGRVGANPYGTFCIDAPTTLTTTAVNSGQYVSLDVVKGYNYTFSVGNVFPSTSETLTVLNDAGVNLSPAVGNTGANGASISNWTSPISGRIRIVLSSSNCTTGTTGGVLTLTLNSANNTQDDQTLAGTNSWIGHIYDFSDSVGVPPTNAFTNYLGNFTQSNTLTGTTNAFSQNYGGDNFCFSFTAGGTTQTVRTETFAVKYLMNTTPAVYPAGCYLVNVTGDDGVRLFIDDVNVFNEWKQQGATNYTNVLVRLTGTSQLRFEYYEKNGANVSNFTIKPVDPTINFIRTSGPILRCAGSTTSIDGSEIVYQGSATNPSIKFQWQSSTDDVNYSDISGATTEDYTVPATYPTLNTQIYYRRKVTGVTVNTASCSYDTAGIAITTRATPVAPVAVAATPTCDGFTANWEASANATTYFLDVSTSNTFSSFVTSGGTTYQNFSVGNVTSRTLTGLNVGTSYYYRVRAANTTCTSASSNDITANTILIIPASVNSPTSTCTQTTLNWNPVAGASSYGIQMSLNEDFTSHVKNGNNETLDGRDIGNVTSYTITNLVPGTTYYYMIWTYFPCSLATSTTAKLSIVGGGTLAKWSGLAWSSNPTIDKNIVFESDYTSTTNLPSSTVLLEGCSCTVNPNVAVTISSGHTLKIANGVEIKGTGTLTFQNNASLIQTNPIATNSGDITYNRTSQPMAAYDYTYWSSPVTGTQTLQTLFKGSESDKYFTLFGTDNWINADPRSIMQKGIGYLARAPWEDSSTNTTYTATFVGEPNNGDISFSDINSGKNYLLGNPYPSGIFADDFITKNSTVISGALYFWTHYTPITNLKYTADDYAVYTLTGGTGTSANLIWVEKIDESGNPVIGTDGNPVMELLENPNALYKPSGYIAAGQSFFVDTVQNVPSGASIVFDNTMRSDNNSQFFKPSGTSNKSRVWLNFANTQGAFKQLLVGYIDGATNNVDRLYDGETYDSNQFIDFYSINDNTKLAVQGRKAPFEIADEVLLGYRSTIQGNFTISIDETDGDLKEQDIFLEDKFSGVTYNLRKSSYTFSTVKGTFDDRFVLKYANKTLGTGDFETKDNEVLVTVKNKEIVVNAENQFIKTIYIYDVSGKLIYEKHNVNEKEFIVQHLHSSQQVLIVKTVLDDDYTETKKVLF